MNVLIVKFITPVSYFTFYIIINVQMFCVIISKCFILLSPFILSSNV